MGIRFISAGAGSGKTHRLTKLLSQRLAARKARPEAVMATTFTNKAAAELVERVRQRLIADGHPLYANAMGQALIGTVNSVCGSLLKRYAFEAGLSPRLEVLAEEAQPLLFAQAVEQAMSRDDLRAMNSLSARLELTDWQQEIKKIVDLARANDVAPGDLAEHGRRSTEELLSYFPAAVEDDLDTPLQAAVRTAVVAVSANEDTTKGTREYLDLLRKAQHRMDSGRLPWSDWVRLSNAKPTKRSQPFAEPVREAAARYGRHPGLRRDIAEWTRRLFDLAAKALTTYQSLKAERGLMDFVDQEHQVLRLLDLPDVASSVAEELDLLLVDEFQDTSPIQLALFLKLAGLAGECIWVGDVKQAIYGFRGADPELMNAVVDGLVREGQPIEILPSSWRSRPALVELANALFVPAFAEYLKEGQVRLDSQRDERLSDAPLRFWKLEGSNSGKRAVALAEGIARLLDGDVQVVDKTSGEPRALRPGDVAVLSRSNANAASYAAALTAAGLAVALHQPGLLATPEVQLTLACLRRLVDSADTLASAEIVALKTSQEPEHWLESRLDYLAEGHPSRQWGLGGGFREPSLAALEALRGRLEFLSPSEVLDDVLVVADVRRDAKAWGPSLGRSAQRLANLETLRGLAAQYEDACRAERGSATVGGFLLWLYALADADLDHKGLDGQADAVQVSTYHRAKGLEWPVVICTDLESGIKSRLWGLSALSHDDAVDLRAPLATRRLRYWPWPFAGLSKGIAVAQRIAEGEAGRADARQQAREAVRLLYVSFTRARDLLILPLQEQARSSPWLDTLGADWLVPQERHVKLPGGGLVACVTERLPVPLATRPVRPDPEQNWFPPAGTPTPKLPAHASPSSAPAVGAAFVGRVIELGPRLALQGKPDPEVLGDALHNILAADLIDPGNARRHEMAAGALARYGLSAALDLDEVMGCASRLQASLGATFGPSALHVEWPVTCSLDNGRRLHGWIDLLVETEAGWVIIDHKSFPGGRAEWPDKALSYSGQLLAYRTAVQRATGRPVLSQWIHFPVAGALVEVVLDDHGYAPTIA